MEVSDQYHTLAALLPGKECGTSSTGDWVNLRASLDIEEKNFFLLSGY
jgi:hypothetical protein